MKFGQFALLLLLGALLFSGCAKKTTEAKPTLSLPQAGAIYSLNDGEGGFRIAKVVTIEAEVVFVHLFTGRWKTRPAAIEAGANQYPAPMAFSPDTFLGMQPVRMQVGTASPEEIETYSVWKNSNSGVL
ncbi:MAG: hypothetical protein H7X97_13495 [Opitutaceae bacterium]|nr:hypothetical protein [Verrucomicrobiales bacterium]